MRQDKNNKIYTSSSYKNEELEREDSHQMNVSDRVSVYDFLTHMYFQKCKGTKMKKYVDKSGYMSEINQNSVKTYTVLKFQKRFYYGDYKH